MVEKKQGANAKPKASQRTGKPQDFSNEYKNKTVSVLLANGKEVVGILVEASRFWIKLQVGMKVVYINKAWIVSIEPR